MDEAGAGLDMVASRLNVHVLLEVCVQCRRQPTPGCWARVPPRPLLAWGFSRAVSRAPRGVS